MCVELLANAGLDELARRVGADVDREDAAADAGLWRRFDRERQGAEQSLLLVGCQVQVDAVREGLVDGVAQAPVVDDGVERELQLLARPGLASRDDLFSGRQEDGAPVGLVALAAQRAVASTKRGRQILECVHAFTHSRASLPKTVQPSTGLRPNSSRYGPSW